jgi:hypothetical protein
MLNNDELSRTLTYIKGRFFVEPVYTNLFEEHTAFKIAPRPGCIVSKETVMDLLKVVCDHEDKNHRPEPLFDSQIWELFEGASISPITKIKTSIFWRTTQSSSQREFFLEIEKLGIKKTYTWLEALMIVIEMVLSENVHYLNKTIIYFKHPRKKDTHAFFITRDSSWDYPKPVLVIGISHGNTSRFTYGSGICCQEIPFYKKMSICLQSLMQKNA